MHLINSRFIDFVSTRFRYTNRYEISAFARDLAATEYTATRNKVCSLARSSKVFSVLDFPLPSSSLLFHIADGQNRSRERRDSPTISLSGQELTVERLQSTQLRRSKLPKSGSRGALRVYTLAMETYRHSIDCHKPNCNIVRSGLGIRNWH